LKRGDRNSKKALPLNSKYMSKPSILGFLHASNFTKKKPYLRSMFSLTRLWAAQEPSFSPLCSFSFFIWNNYLSYVTFIVLFLINIFQNIAIKASTKFSSVHSKSFDQWHRASYLVYRSEGFVWVLQGDRGIRNQSTHQGARGRDNHDEIALLRGSQFLAGHFLPKSFKS